MTQVDYPVKYVNMPKNQFLANDLPENFTLKVDAHGFTLLRHKLNLSFTPIVLNIDNIIKSQQQTSNSQYTINTSALNNRIAQQISNELKVLEIQPASFTIILDSLRSKVVPVVADIGLQFKPQYNLSSPLVLKPAEVTVSGPRGFA